MVRLATGVLRRLYLRKGGLRLCHEAGAKETASLTSDATYKRRREDARGHAMNLLWGLVVVLVVLWLLGFSMHVGGGLIHLLLVIAVIVIVVRLVSGRGV